MTPDQDLSARLDACQFCGGYCSEIADVSVAEYPNPKFQVQCVACGLSGPIAPSEHEAAKLWNLVHTDHERAVQAAVAKAVEVEREACAAVAARHAETGRKKLGAAQTSDDAHDWALIVTRADMIYDAIRSRGVAG